MIYATVNDVIDLWRPLSAEEQEIAEKLIPIVSSSLRYEADKVGKDLDELIGSNANLPLIVKSVVVDVVKRYINDNAQDGATFSQMSESVGGYTVSGTYLVPGGGLFIKRSELARLGLRRSRVSTLELTTWE